MDGHFCQDELVVGEQGMPMRGILSQLGGTFVVQVPMNDYENWIAQKGLLRDPPAQGWLRRVRNPNDVFFGYCSKASKLAKDVKDYLEQDGLQVLDWATAFRPGKTIMEEVRRAASVSRCGLFLFTADDPVGGPCCSPGRSEMAGGRLYPNPVELAIPMRIFQGDKPRHYA
jgi:hypothetical protein